MFVLRGIIFDSIPSAEWMAHQPWLAASLFRYAAGPVFTCKADMTNCDSVSIRATFFSVRTLPHVMRLLTPFRHSTVLRRRETQRAFPSAGSAEAQRARTSRGRAGEGGGDDAYGTKRLAPVNAR